jgi:hypothetical protein
MDCLWAPGLQPSKGFSLRGWLRSDIEGRQHLGRVPTAKEYLLFPALVSIYKWLSFVPKSHGKCVQVKESGNHSNLGSGGQQGNRLQKQGDYASQQVDLP